MSRPRERKWKQVSQETWRFLRRCGVKGLKTLDSRNEPIYVAEEWAVCVINVKLPLVKFHSKSAKAIRRAVKDTEFRDAIEAAIEADMLSEFIQQQIVA